jgi:hypothetical protein
MLSALAGGRAGAQLPDGSSAVTAEVRVVHGSPDAGPVTVSVDGKPLLTDFLYGTVTPYVALKPGTYTLAVTTAGKATVSLKAAVAGGKFYTVVATGELAPKASPRKPNIALTAYVDAPFTRGVPAANFHHAAPAAEALAKTVPFGFGFLANPANDLLAGVKFGADSGPVALPPDARSEPIEFYAVSVDAVTLIPNQIEALDFRNVLPSLAGPNVSVFAIDGPGAAADPTVSGTDVVRLIGSFDAAGT